MSKIVAAKHPLAIRWFHWVNFPVLSMMVYSGLLIYWANDVNTIRIGGHQLFHFFPANFYLAFNLGQQLSDGMGIHFFFMWFFAINGILYVLYTLFSGEWRYLIPNKASFGEAIQVVLYDLHLTKIEPPKRKFNGAQQIAYTSIIIMGMLATLTGLAIYKPIQLSWLTQLLGGYVPARFEHFWLMVGFCLFFVIHITQVIRAGWNNYLSMVTGYEIVDVPDEHALPIKEEAHV